MSAFSRAVLTATRNPVVARTITETRPGRAVAHRFVAGDDLVHAIPAATALNGRGLTVSLDLLGEEVHDAPTAVAALDGYLASIARIGAHEVDANVSVKLTQLGLAFDQALAADAIDHLAEAAKAVGTTVTIDMEDSRFTGSTVDIYAAAQARYGNLGVCLQAYLRRSPDDLDRLIPLGGHIRLCKGAYVEPESIAFQGKDEVDEAFRRLLERLMAAETVKPAVATHDSVLIDLAKSLSASRRSPWEFQMLYGVRAGLQTALASEGYSMRIYLPFGSEWYPYLTRRLAERPANALFFLRALVGRD